METIIKFATHARTYDDVREIVARIEGLVLDENTDDLMVECSKSYYYIEIKTTKPTRLLQDLIKEGFIEE